MNLSLIVILTICHVLIGAKGTPRLPREDDCIARITSVSQQLDSSTLLMTYTPSSCTGAEVKIYYIIDSTQYPIQHVPGVPGLVLILDVRLTCLIVEISIETFDIYGTKIGTDNKEWSMRLPAIDNLELDFTEKGLRLSWEEQSFAKECSLTYVVEYDDQIQTCLNYNECILEDLMCFGTTLSVYAVKENFNADRAYIQYEGLGYVTNVQIFETSNQLVVVWQPPECDIDDEVYYIVKYTTNDTLTIETTDTHHYLDYTSNSCSDVQITITAVIGNIPGPPYNASYSTALGEVENIQVKHSNSTVHAQWDAPNGASECDLDYRVTLEMETEIFNVTVQNTSYVDIKNVYMKPCENASLTITPIRGVILGSPLKRNVAGGFGPVKDIIIEDTFIGQDIFASFNEPENTELCNLSYAIHYETPVCLVRNVSITAFTAFGEVSQQETTMLSVEQKLGSVSDLAITREDETVRATWNAIEIPEDCGIVYNVTYEWKDETYQITTTETMVTIFETICFPITVWVVPIVENVIGTSSNVSLPAC